MLNVYFQCYVLFEDTVHASIERSLVFHLQIWNEHNFSEKVFIV